MIDSRQAGTWGDCGVWSFGGSKLLTAGRGGAMYTSRSDIAQRAKVFCERGNDAFPLSELQAAVLVPQLAMLAEANEQRAKAVATINHVLQEQSVPIVAGKNLQTERSTLQAAPALQRAAYYKFGLWYNVSQECDTPIDTFVAALQAEGVAVDRAFRGFHRRPESRCRKMGDLPQAKRAAQQTLILHHPVLLAGSEAAEKVARAIVKVWKGMS
jgi:dTDP-4-amino-4,6-dideoxygalactose transaminase